VILLDTHVLVWSRIDPGKLSRVAASAIRRASISDGLAISAITLVELAGLIHRGRVRLPGSVESAMERVIEGLTIKPLTPDISVLTTLFPPDFPSDPMDRIIAATARAEGMALVTADQRILNCSLVKTIW
jgi:PIN domain nuclease of toxin-antitoxin system